LALALAGCKTTEGPNQTAAAHPAPAVSGKPVDVPGYIAIAAGWRLEQRCKFLTESQKSAFDWNVSEATRQMAKSATPQAVVQMQGIGEREATAASCDDTGRRTVQSALASSGDVAFAATGRRYSAETRRDYDSERLQMLVAGQSLDDRCHAMPPQIRQEYEALVDGISQRFVQRNGVAAMDAVRLGSKSDGMTVPCQGAAVRLRLILEEARRMAQAS
jgi:hypothetical protein